MQAQNTFYSQNNPAPLVMVEIQEAKEMLAALSDLRTEIFNEGYTQESNEALSANGLINLTFSKAAKQLGFSVVDGFIRGFKTLLDILDKDSDAKIIRDPIVLATNVLKLIESIASVDDSLDKAARYVEKINSFLYSFQHAKQGGHPTSNSQFDSAIVRPAVTEYFSTIASFVSILTGLNQWRMQSININNGTYGLYAPHMPVAMPGGFVPRSHMYASQGVQTTPDSRRSAFQEKSEVPGQAKDKSPS